MRRHPVEDHTKLRLVAAIHKGGKTLGRAKPGTWCKLRERLVTPGTTEGVLHDGQQFEVGKTHAACIRQQAVAEFLPVQAAPAVLADAQPGTCMHLVDRQRSR